MKKKLSANDVMIWVLFAVIVGIVIWSLVGCRTQKEFTDRNHTEHDTVYVHKLDTRYDSIYVDKWHTIYKQGDTLWRVDSIVDVRWLIKNTTDTMYRDRVVTDSISVEKVVEVRKRNWYDKFVSWGFWSLLAVVLAAVAGWCLKKFYFKK